MEPQKKKELVEMQGRETEQGRVMVQQKERIRDEGKGQWGPVVLIGYFLPYLYLWEAMDISYVE